MARILLLLAAALGAYGQEFEFDKRCGDPRMESQAWSLQAATVLAPSGGDAIRVRINGNGKRDTIVRLPGVAGIEPVFAAYIKKYVAGHDVSLWLGSGFGDRLPSKLDAMVSVGQEEDLGLLLIKAGAARYVDPKPYTMSGYQRCLYKLADQKQ